MVEPAQPLEAELGNPLGAELASRLPRLGLDPLDDRLEVARIDVALVGGADQAAKELGSIEWLPVAVALDHFECLGNCPLIGGEAMATATALTAAPDRLCGLPGLEDSSGCVAARTVHSSESTYQ